MDPEQELVLAHHASTDKYTYFLLAAVGACIAFALSQTKDSRLSWAHLPLGLAVFSWAMSFWCGCRRIDAFNQHLRLNALLLRVQAGRDDLVGKHPQAISIVSKDTLEMIDKVGARTARFVRGQVGFLIAGAALYIVWHVLEMYVRRG